MLKPRSSGKHFAALGRRRIFAHLNSTFLGRHRIAAAATLSLLMCVTVYAVLLAGAYSAGVVNAPDYAGGSSSEQSQDGAANDSQADFRDDQIGGGDQTAVDGQAVGGGASDQDGATDADANSTTGVTSSADADAAANEQQVGDGGADAASVGGSGSARSGGADASGSTSSSGSASSASTGSAGSSSAGAQQTLDVQPGHPAVATAQQKAEAKAASRGERTLSAETEDYRVTVAYADGVGVPEGASLRVQSLAEDTDAFGVARTAVVSAKRAEMADFQESSLGLTALDISILDASGAEVEPTGEVQVSIEAKVLASASVRRGMEVRHLVRAAAPASNSAGVVAQPVDADVTLNGTSTVAEFGVSSFSVFVIAWTRDSSSAQRVGSVRLHTVDQDGNEIQDPDTYTTSELREVSGETGILTIADWIKTKDPTGYTYEGAHLEKASGADVTGLKVAEQRTTSGGTTTTSYVLQYTADASVTSSSSWTNMVDAIADQSKNNADIYLVFQSTSATGPTDNAHLTVHYVDESGNELATSRQSSFTIRSDSGSFTNRWNGYTFERGDFDLTSPSGYTFKGDYLGSTFDDEHNIPSTLTGASRNYAVQYRYNSSTGIWQTGIGAYARDTSSTHRAFDGYIVDVYRVYTYTGSRARTFMVHYVNELKQAIGGQADETFTLDPSTGSAEKELDTGSLVRTVDGRVFLGSYLGSESTSLTENETYVTTDYPHVSRVRVDSDGKAYFQTSVGGGASLALTMVRSNRWSYTTTSGRTFTLRRAVTGSGDNQSVRFSLVDDQVGTTAVDLNLSQVSGDTETYVGSSGSEGTSSVYTVTATTAGGTTTYALEVSEWIQNDLTDIYQVYGDPSVVQNPEVEAKNDLVYTGHLVAQLDPTLQYALEHAGQAGTTGEGISNVRYTWYRIDNDTSASAVGTAVERRQNGDSWNVAADASERTWVDLAADDGALSSTRSSVIYYCVLEYDYNGEHKTATSNRLSMINYNELMNGGFETPAMSTNQTSNAWYYPRGIWRSTGLGTGSMVNHDIEIVNTTWNGWWSSYNFASASAFQAHGGNQFAELNCEAAGALYQDVVTLPYENLNYWLSHRARGSNRDTTPEYDSMYLVIMPTRLAMTSGANGGELKEQSDLESFIQSHGGFATSLATGEEAVVTYRDEASGILIERISSSDQAWHTVSVANGYTAMAGLTRFFFVAGPTASGSNTVGNFLDDVGFSQDLPEPSDDEFQLVVTKTFSNLELADIARLAENGTSQNTFTLTVRAYDEESQAEGRPAVGEEGDTSDTSAALNGTRLTFSVSGDNQLTPQATAADGSDLFSTSNGSNGTVTANDDAGTVTITWTLLANKVYDTEYYTVDETGEALEGYTATTSQTGSVGHTDNEADNGLSTANVATVTGGDVVRMGFTNSYNQNSQISVQKVFSGITPTTVQELSDAQNPYTVTLTRTADDGSAQTLSLVNDEQRPYTNVTLPADVQSVSLSTRQGTGGVSILTWTVTGWDAGDYTVQETGYHPQGEASQYNTLAQTTINGEAVSETSEGEGAEVYIAKGVTIGGTSADVPELKPSDPDTATNVIGDATGATLTDAETNLLVVQYTNGGRTGYLVWTPRTVGANVRQAILNHIQQKFNNSSATLGQVSFYSSENPGAMQVNDASVTYDADTRRLTFASSTNTVWQSYYGTYYTLECTVTRTVDGQEVTETEVVATDEPEIRIRNDYNPILKIQKVEKDHNDVLLGGASFQLYRYEGDGSSGARQYYLEQGSTVSAPVFGETSDATPAKTFTTSSDEGSALGTVNVGVLSEGTYYLQETVTPDGYNTVPTIRFHVGSDGVVSLLEGTGDDVQSVSRTDYAEVTLADPYYTITVSDEPGSPFPSLGGSGEFAISLAYVACLAAATLFAGWLVRRKGRG